MDSFQVSANDTSVLAASHLVEEMREDLYNVEEMFPVLIGGQVAYFHDIDGGFHRDEGYHVVNLIHRVQGPDSPPNKLHAANIEVHLSEWFYNLSVTDIWQMGDYPDEDFVLSLKVEDYKMGRHPFSEALTADIDKREQEFSPDK